MSPYLTPQELSIVAAVNSSCILSFLLPQCDPAKFLHAYFETNVQPLDERLASSLNTNHGLCLPPGTRNKSLIGEQDDMITSVAFYRFLEHGLGAFVATGRAFLGDRKAKNDVSLLAGADLINMLAMAVSPSPCSLNEPGIDESQQDLIDLLSSSTFPYGFHLVYADRVRLVKLCAEDIVIPENSGEDGLAISDERKKFVSATRRLRRALLDFASHTAQSDRDACLAHKACINILIYEGNSSDIQCEFGNSLNELLKSRSKEIVSAISDNLSDLVEKYNGSRYYADGEFTRSILVLLTKCIQERVINKDDNLGDQEQQVVDGKHTTKRQKKECRAYHLIALMKVTASLFYFMLDMDVLEKITGEALREEALKNAKIEEETKLRLIRNVSSLLLIYPFDELVVTAASELLSLAFSYDKKYLSDISNVKHIFFCTRKSIENWNAANQNGGRSIIECLKGVIYTVSRRSDTYAFNLLTFCTEVEPKLESIVSVVSSVKPHIATRVLASSKADSNDAVQRLLTQLSSTLTLNKKQLSFASVEKLLEPDDLDNHWNLYQITRQCFVTSNFSLARQILEKYLVHRSIQQSSFLWLHSLVRLAAAEETLRTDGYSAIPSSLFGINACHSLILSLANLFSGENENHQFGVLGAFRFQLEVLVARVEFLQLIKDARCTCLDSILTSNHSLGNTRTKMHLKNLSKCFNMLTSRYMKMYRMFGLHCSQQSLSSLRGLISMCSFLSELIDLMMEHNASWKINSTSLDVDDEQQDVAMPLADKNHPMGILLSRLRAGASEARISPDPIKTNVLLDAIDVLLRCPVPFPSSFFVIKPIPMIYSTIIQTNGQDPIEILSGIPLKLTITGMVPDTFMRSAKIPFSLIIAWPSITYAGNLVDYDEDGNETKSINEDDTPLMHRNKPDAVATNLLPGGNFILSIELDPIIEEGYYFIDIQMGCRDVRCGEWFLPTQNNMHATIRVADI